MGRIWRNFLFLTENHINSFLVILSILLILLYLWGFRKLTHFAKLQIALL